MKRLRAAVFAASFLSSSLIFSPAFAHSPGHGHPGGHELELPATTACFENVLSAARANGVASGIAAAVVLDGRIVYRRGFGTVSPTSAQAVLPTTRFRIASLTKMMTATALLSLAEDHRLPLHAPVTHFLPGLSIPGEPGWSDSLTPHLLLSHQGALFDRLPINGPRDDGALRAAFYDPAFTTGVQLTVAPGTFFNYSNPNFMLAGLVAEAAAGMPYREVMRRRVFKPLHMTRAAFLPSEVLADNDFAYGVRVGAVFAPDSYDVAVTRPAGLAWTSVEDLAKFSLFLLRGDRDTLSDRMWRVLQTPKVNTYTFLDRVKYAYGLQVENGVFLPDSNRQIQFYDGVKLVWHNGAIAGFQSLMMTLPRQGFGFTAVINGDTPVPATDLFPCYQTAAAEAVGDRLPAPSPFPEPQIQPDRFGDYVGTFHDRTGAGGDYVLSLTPEGQLRIFLPAFPNFQYNPILQPASRDNFFFYTQAGRILITGFREAGSAVKHLRTRPFVWTRVEPGATALRSAAAPSEEEFIKAMEAAALEQDSALLQTR
jgi:CubicO group peptidase (beta-lactamase class C family)